MPGQGLFSLVCPDCGRPLAVSGEATASCHSCQRYFIVRLGHLIPVVGSAERADATGRGGS